jgi:ATP-binding cassette, subfamily B, bacterial PglK
LETLLLTLKKLRALLTRREQIQALMLLAMMLLLGLIEMAGVASIFPLIAVLSDPSLIEKNRWLHLFYDTLGFSSYNAFFIFLSAAVFLITVARTAFTAVTSYALQRYSQMRSHRLSVVLLSSYLRRPYTFFLGHHTADMAKSVLSEVDQVVLGSLMPTLQLISQSIISACIIAVVALVDPVVASIALFAVTGAYGLVYFSVRKLLRRKGIDRNAANLERFSIAHEVLGGVKEVKVGGLENGYIRRFERASLKYAKLRTHFAIVREVPRHALELVAIGGILLVIMVLLFRKDGNLTAALPTMAVYAFAGLRLLPSIQTLYQSVVAIRFDGPTLDRLHDDLIHAEHVSDLRPAEPIGLRDAICIDRVSFAYPDSDRTALREISLNIRAKTKVGVVGPSGAGKSTLIDIILGLLEPQEGAIKVDGVAIDRTNVRSWFKTVGYVPQQIFLADDSIASNIALGVPVEAINMEAVENAAKLANLHSFIVNDLPKGYGTEVGDRGIRLSGGQRQRIGIARALYHGPSVLVFDEATSALDTATEQEVMAEVNKLSSTMTVILIAHRETTLNKCDVVFRLENGCITESGTPAAVLKAEASQIE